MKENGQNKKVLLQSLVDDATDAQIEFDIARTALVSAKFQAAQYASLNFPNETASVLTAQQLNTILKRIKR